MAIPKKDSLLVAWGGNWDQKVGLNPTLYSLTAAQQTAFHTGYTTYVSAYDAVATARESGTRSKLLTTTKNTKRDLFLHLARELYAFVQNSNAVTDANKEDIGVVVRKHPSPAPTPAFPPNVIVKRAFGRTLTVQIHDSQTEGGRAKAPGCTGASVFSHVGPTAPPPNVANWTFEGNTGKTTVAIAFPDDVPAGATVWIIAYWFNARGAGPLSLPVSANLPGGSVQQAA